MKISELVKKTNVSKETIHYYIREGALPRPRKSSKNSAEYDEGTVAQIQLIKDLQENFFLPLAEIKKIIKKQKKLSAIDKIKFRFHIENLRPVDQISPDPIQGKQNFLKETGMSEKWLDKMQQWEIITPEQTADRLIFAPDDVIIAKLVVKMGELGGGPRDGLNPEELKLYIRFVKDVVLPTHLNFLKNHLHLLKSAEFQERGIKLIEAVGLFFYHVYRKTIKEEVIRILNSIDQQDTAADPPSNGD